MLIRAVLGQHVWGAVDVSSQHCMVVCLRHACAGEAVAVHRQCQRPPYRAPSWQWQSQFQLKPVGGHRNRAIRVTADIPCVYEAGSTGVCGVHAAKQWAKRCVMSPCS